MVELTGDLSFIVPLLVCVMVVKWVSDAFGPYSIYDEQIFLNEYPYLDKKTNANWDATACDLMSTKFVSIPIVREKN